MPTKLDMAKWLSGARAEEAAQQRPKLSLATGTAITDSTDGWVYVDLPGDTVSADGQQGVRVRTDTDVRIGDSVSVALDGAEGTATVPKVIGATGGGDRTRQAIADVTKRQTGSEDIISRRIGDIEKVQAGYSATIETIKGTTDQLGSDVDGLKDTQTSIRSYMTFTDPSGGDPKLTIGTSSSKMKSELGNTKLAFVSDGTEVASIDGDTSMLNAQRVQIGTYRWMPTNGGANLTLVYVG